MLPKHVRYQLRYYPMEVVVSSLLKASGRDLAIGLGKSPAAEWAALPGAINDARS